MLLSGQPMSGNTLSTLILGNMNSNTVAFYKALCDRQTARVPLFIDDRSHYPSTFLSGNWSVM